MKLDKEAIDLAARAEDEYMAGPHYHLYFLRMSGIDMEIVCEIYGSLIRPMNMAPANNWFNNLTT
jgi:hypothetical protein